MSNPWILLHQWNKDGPKLRVFTCKLCGQGGEDRLEIAPVLVVSRTKEGGTKQTICKHSFCNCLRNCGLPCASQPIQPVDRGFVKVPRPEFNLVQNGLACPLEATFAVTIPVLSPLCAIEVIEGGCFSCEILMLGTDP